MRARTQNERRVGRRNWVAGALFGVIVATVFGAWAATTFKKMQAGKPATAADVNQAHQDLATAIDNLEKKVTSQAAEITKLKTEPDCPPGYTKDTTAPSSIVVCKKGSDELVKVGDFWVDRYEMSIVDATTYSSGSCNGAGGTQYGAGTSDNYPTSFPDSAKVTGAASRLYACSRSGTVPSRMMTWFQAAAACTFAGKHLCTNGEWQAAAFGTPDDSVSCNISTSAAEKAGSRTGCVSQSGAYDMVGNLWEWVDWWGQAGKSWMTSDGQKATPWPSSEYGGDATYNINGRAANTSWVNGSPAAALRGGYWNNGTGAGVFALSLNHGPSPWSTSHGARCCRQ